MKKWITMKTLMFCFIITTAMAQDFTIYNFNSSQDLNDWQIVNDGVMGGLSQSSINLDEEGNAVFTGQISLENNGGFASVRHETDITGVQKYSYINLKVKGKPSTYQFRIKKNEGETHSYIQEFEVTSEWETVQLKLSSFYPRYRGRSLNLPNFEANVIREVAILIGNGKKEEFKLEIDKIYLSK
jgi:hypothetical protein